MAAKPDTASHHDAKTPVLLSTGAGDRVTLPGDFPLDDASISRVGDDLVVRAPGRAPVIVRDYFASDARPALVTAGGAQLPGGRAVQLAAGTSPGIEAVGRVETVSGHAFVVHTDGTREALAVGGRLADGDILETGGDGAVGLVLADETSLSMGADGRMVLDEMVYDPGTRKGSLSMSVVKGVYTVVSGLASKTDPDAMVIDTPVGRIGVRGTQVGIDFTEGRNLNVVMMQEVDGYVGEVFVRNAAGLQVMNQAHQVVFVGGFDDAPTFLNPVDNAGVARTFATTLAHLPSYSGHENHYSVPHTQPTGGLERFETHVPTGDREGTGGLDETIRVVAGDYTRPHAAAETAAVPVPETPAPETPVAAPPREVGVEETATGRGNESPLAFDTSRSTREDQAVSGQLTAFDPDNDKLTYTLTDTGAPKHGTVAINPDGTYTYTPDPDYSGVDRFTYLVSDGRGGTTVATMTVEVAPVADQPALQVSDVTVDTGGLPTDDRITGTAAPETLVGGGGSDTVIGGGGDDVLFGDSSLLGALTLPVDIRASLADTDGSEHLGVTVTGVPDGATLSAGTDLGDGAWSLTPDDLSGLSMTLPEGHHDDFHLHVTATALDTDADTGATDTASTTSALDYTFTGGEPGDDLLRGGGGNDILYGGAGNDDLRGEADNDILYGQAGDDTMSGGTGDDVLYGGTGNDVMSGDGGADTLYGEAGHDVLSGGAGSDVLYGGAGNDVLYGGGDSDTLYGGTGDDRLEGGGGDDTLVGGPGNDVLVGGPGTHDTFVFQPDSGHDTIEDYHAGETLRFEGPEFSHDNVSLVQDGSDVHVMFADQPDVSVTLNDIDLSRGYQITPDPDTHAVLITFKDSA